MNLEIIENDGRYSCTVDGATADLGSDKEFANRIAEQLADSNRPNVEIISGGLYVCFGFHDRHEDCDWQLLNPEQINRE